MNHGFNLPDGCSNHHIDDYFNPKVQCKLCEQVYPADQMTWRREDKFKEPVPYCPKCINIINDEV